MNRDFVEKTIESLTQLLDDNYVFPETAAAIRIDLTERLGNNEYDNIDDASVFGGLLTKELQNLSQDKHLHIWHSIQVPEHESPQKESLNQSDDSAFLTMVALDNYGFTKVERLPGNIGLLEFQSFMPPEIAGDTVAGAMSFLANTSCMIIDIRNNFGGSPFMVAFLSSYLLEPKPTHLNDLYWRAYNSTQQYWSIPYVPGKRFGGTKPLYILTGPRTFSAAEEFAYNLQALGRAKVVGERTGGGAHPGRTHRINNQFEVFIPNGRAINPITKTNWEGVGVGPDIEVSQDKAFDLVYITLLKSELMRLLSNPMPGQERLLDEIKQTIEKKEQIAGVGNDIP